MPFSCPSIVQAKLESSQGFRAAAWKIIKPDKNGQNLIREPKEALRTKLAPGQGWRWLPAGRMKYPGRTAVVQISEFPEQHKGQDQAKFADQGNCGE